MQVVKLFHTQEAAYHVNNRMHDKELNIRKINEEMEKKLMKSSYYKNLRTTILKKNNL